MRQIIPSAISAEPFPVGGRQGIGRTSHNLGADSLFSERSIAAIVSAASPQSRQTTDTFQLREVAQLVAGADGHRLLDDVRAGVSAHIIREPERYDLRFDIILDRLKEAHQQLNGSDHADSEMVIIVAGRNARLNRGVSGRNLALWMVKGGANVTLYPRRPPYVSLPALANDGGLGALRRDATDVPGGNEALRETLAAGQMLTWPQHTPHEITFRDALNIAVLTSSSSAASRRINRVLEANAAIARWTGRAPQSAAVSGFSGRVKSALVLLAAPAADVRDLDGDQRGFAVALSQQPQSDDAVAWRLHGPAAN